MAEFEEMCQRLGIALFVLPPRSPKLKGQAKAAVDLKGGSRGVLYPSLAHKGHRAADGA